jgi:DNA modification methylase
MVGVFREVRRVLRDDGTLWLNMGDCYASNLPGARTQSGFPQNHSRARQAICRATEYRGNGIKPKDLIGQPWRLAFALQADGWWLRSDIIWAKPNPMPESVTDRPTKAHEYLFLLSKSARYYYDADAVREPMVCPEASTAEDVDRVHNRRRRHLPGHRQEGLTRGMQMPERWVNGSGRNLRDVWTIPTEAFPEAHFATFPTKLVEPCIKAGTSERGCCPACGKGWERVVETSHENPGNRSTNGPRSTERKHLDHGTAGFDLRLERRSITLGWAPNCECETAPGYVPESEFEDCLPATPAVVLDPFAGSGTTGLVAHRLGRDFIGIELKPEYAEMARRRIRDDCPLFAEPEVHEAEPATIEMFEDTARGIRLERPAEP